MVRRLLAAALAFFVIGSPVASGVCEATCAAGGMVRASATARTEHHSCHGQSSTAEPTVNGAAHVCGHPGDLPMGTDQSLRVVAAPAVAVATFSLIPPDAGTLNSRSNEVEHRPPGSVALTTHLRI